jgi:hypothetical protein
MNKKPYFDIYIQFKEKKNQLNYFSGILLINFLKKNLKNDIDFKKQIIGNFKLIYNLKI